MTKTKTKSATKAKPQEKKILLGHVGVDSGQLLITDPCYLHDWKDNPPEGEERPCKGLYSYSYDGACSATGAEGKFGGALRFALGHEGAGVALSTGFGDGVYPVYAYVRDCGEWGPRVVRVEVEFADEDDESEEG